MQVVSLHCALTDETKHLINTERLGLMKKNAVLVNASRGPVIDEVALVKHLQENPDFRLWFAQHLHDAHLVCMHMQRLLSVITLQENWHADLFRSTCTRRSCLC